MEENRTVAVEMTADQFAEYEQMKREKAEAQARSQAKDNRKAYDALVDETIARAIPALAKVSESLREEKAKVLKEFQTVLDMKASVIVRKRTNEDEQRSHTFTNTAGNMRVKLGVYVTDDYRDTAEDGVAIVKECIEELGENERSRVLVKMVMSLLSRDAKGTLKAANIVKLRKHGEELGDARFMEGVQIIEEAYQPAISKQYIHAEVKNENGAWVSIPLGMTEA